MTPRSVNDPTIALAPPVTPTSHRRRRWSARYRSHRSARVRVGCTKRSSLPVSAHQSATILTEPSRSHSWRMSGGSSICAPRMCAAAPRDQIRARPVFILEAAGTHMFFRPSVSCAAGEADVNAVRRVELRSRGDAYSARALMDWHRSRDASAREGKRAAREGKRAARRRASPADHAGRGGGECRGV